MRVWPRHVGIESLQHFLKLFSCTTDEKGGALQESVIEDWKVTLSDYQALSVTLTGAVAAGESVSVRSVQLQHLCDRLRYGAGGRDADANAMQSQIALRLWLVG